MAQCKAASCTKTRWLSTTYLWTKHYCSTECYRARNGEHDIRHDILRAVFAEARLKDSWDELTYNGKHG